MMEQDNDTKQDAASAKKAEKNRLKAAREAAAGEINPDTYWSLYMSFRATNFNEPSWNRAKFLKFLQKSTGVDYLPDNTRIYQKHAYCCTRWAKLKAAGQIPRFDKNDFPLPPTSRSLGDEAFLKLAGGLYGS